MKPLLFNNTFKNNYMNNAQLIHSLPAGVLPGDSSIEMFADRNAQQLHYFENGERKLFSDLPATHKAQIYKMLMGDRGARKALSSLPYDQAIHAYAYCLWGAADACADFTANGALQAPDNFRCNISGCTCHTWEHKKMRYNGNIISGRELQVLDLLATDLTDEAIAATLFITRSTVNTHKKNLFTKFNVQSTPALLHIAAVAKILQ